MEAGVARDGVDRRGEKNKNSIQRSPGAVDRSDITRALPGVGFNGFGKKIMVGIMKKLFVLNCFRILPPGSC